jgi:hypothetical protein
MTMIERNAARPRLGRVERLTSTTVFVVLVALSVLVVSPVILLGLVVSIAMLASGANGLAILGLAGGGLAGLVGLWLGRTPEERLRRGIVEAAIVLLAVGMVTALIVSGIVGAMFLSSRPWDREAIALAAAALVPHAVLILAACGSIQRMGRRYAARTGEAFDKLPVSFLLLALGQAAVGAAVTLGMSMS